MRGRASKLVHCRKPRSRSVRHRACAGIIMIAVLRVSTRVNDEKVIVNEREYISAADVASMPGEDYTLLYGQFLDDFRHRDQPGKAMLIAEPPRSLPDRPAYYDAMLAASCESLAKDFSLSVPSWVYDPHYYLPSPVYAFDTNIPEYRKLLEDTTPGEFSSRNVFFGDTVMTRC